MPGVALFASALFVVQQLEGTALYFSAGCVAFILLSALAFNAGGGLTRAAGAYIFFYSMLVVIVGITYKALLGEPAQSNLLAPHTDILVYVGGSAGLLVAALLSRLLVRRTPFLQNVLPEPMMYRASVGCIAFGVAGAFGLQMLGEAGFRLLTAFTQLNQLIPLGMIIGIMYVIRRTGGAHSLNMPVLIGGAYVFGFFGLLAFSKQGMLTPLLCWLLPVCALRYRVSAMQVLGILAGVFVVFYFLVPYSQYGRRFAEPDQSISERAALSASLLSDPSQLRRNYESDPGTAGYYNKPQGFWDRLQFVSVDDPLVNATDEGKVFGLSPIPISFINVIPHVIWANKPVKNFGNLYAHEIGNMNAEDYSTGISFSPTAEAYHMAKWIGLLAVAPACWLMFFVVYDNLLGDLRTTPWGLLALALLAHVAPEGGLTGTVWLVTFGVEILLFCALFSRWVAPYFAIAFLGPKPESGPVFSEPPVPIRRNRVRNRRVVSNPDGLERSPGPAS